MSRGFTPLEGTKCFDAVYSKAARVKRSNALAGFSLIELLISAGIITVISSLVLVRFHTFDSTVLLKSLAYEVAMSIREAQVYSVSVVSTQGGAADFEYPYGMTFFPQTASYTFFQFANPSVNVDPYYDAAESSPDAIDVNVFSIGRPLQVEDVCIVVSSTEDCDVARLDVSFRRPEFKALFYADGYGGVQADIEEGLIKIRSVNGGDIWVVKVGLLGQISVYKE